MPNALPSGPGTRVFAGARAIFMFNGEVIGFASGCNGTEEIQYEAVDTLDHLEIREYVPTGYRVIFAATIFRTIARGQVSNNRDAPGSLKEQRIFPHFDEILRLEGVDAVIIDEITNKQIFMLHTVKCTGYDFSVTARQIVSQNVRFNAIRAFDESEITASAPVAVGSSAA